MKVSNPSDFQDLVSFFLANTPELSALEVDDAYREGGTWIDLYYRDTTSSVDKEIIWAGDGLQIWLQLLFHVWRQRDAPVLLLDEPDVFLHPDLQRRLIRVLETHAQQTILASHAPEMASEAESGSVVWIERSRRSARRVRGDRAFSDLTQVLGSGFNLAVARALRSRLALFVEGDDMQMIRLAAKAFGLSNIEAERGLTVIPIGGFSRWPGVEAFSWLKEDFLGPTVGVATLLDRDYRSDAELAAIEKQLAEANVQGHIWRYKEIENYFLEPSLLAAVTGLTETDIEVALDNISDELRHEVLGQYIAQALAASDRGINPATVSAQALREFESMWADAGVRRGLIPGKTSISRMNVYLQERKLKAISARRLASAVTRTNTVPEFYSVLKAIEDQLT